VRFLGDEMMTLDGPGCWFSSHGIREMIELCDLLYFLCVLHQTMTTIDLQAFPVNREIDTHFPCHFPSHSGTPNSRCTFHNSLPYAHAPSTSIYPASLIGGIASI
jgi:hypothetical protein